MNEKRKPISLIKPDEKIINTEYDKNGYKIMTPSHNFSDVEIYPEYQSPVECDLKPKLRSAQQQEKESLNILQPAKPEKQIELYKKLTPDDTDDVHAKVFIVLHIIFLFLYITPVYFKPSDALAFSYIVVTLLLSALSCIFILRKSDKIKKILMSVLRVLTLSQLFMSIIGAYVGYYLI